MKIYTPLKFNELKRIQNVKQQYCDCYLLSTLHALTKNGKGQAILSKNINKNENNEFRIIFNNIDRKRKDYYISKADIDAIENLDFYNRPIDTVDTQENIIIKSLESAMNKLIQKHPFKKPLYCRFAFCDYDFEFNSPSNFLYLFTGIKPIKKKKKSLKMNLSWHKKKNIKLLKEIGKKENNSFIAGTGEGKNIRDLLREWHCYVIDYVDNKNKTVGLIDKRTNSNITLSFDTFIKKIKFIVGYFHKDL